jgi:hypothetical protein
MTQMGDTFEGAATLIGKFRDFILGGVALNLNGGHDSVANGVKNGVARLVNALGEIDAAFFNEKAEYGLGEGNMLADKCQILGDGSGVVGTQYGRKLQRDFNGKDERAADGGATLRRMSVPWMGPLFHA